MVALAGKSALKNSSQNSIGIRPKLINGTGVLAERTFWLDAGNKLQGSTAKFKKQSGRDASIYDRLQKKFG